MGTESSPSSLVGANHSRSSSSVRISTTASVCAYMSHIYTTACVCAYMCVPVTMCTHTHTHTQHTHDLHTCFIFLFFLFLRIDFFFVVLMAGGICWDAKTCGPLGLERTIGLDALNHATNPDNASSVSFDIKAALGVQTQVRVCVCVCVYSTESSRRRWEFRRRCLNKTREY